MSTKNIPIDFVGYECYNDSVIGDLTLKLSFINLLEVENSQVTGHVVFILRLYCGFPGDFLFFKEIISMENRIAGISIIVSQKGSVEQLNSILSSYGEYIIGRMGVPVKARGINVISVVIDAPANTINGLAAKLGRLPGVTAKAVYSAEK